MIAPAERALRPTRPASWQAGFLDMLPTIQRYASLAFRGLPAERREEAMQDTIISAMVAYRRLFEQGKLDVAYPSVLARHAAARYRDGRRVATRLNHCDVTSGYAQQWHGIQREPLGAYDEATGQWQEALVEDRRAGPAETAASRLDFAHWLSLLPTGQRSIAELLATGESATAVARQHRLSPARITQIRRLLERSWRAFQGSPTDKVAVTA